MEFLELSDGEWEFIRSLLPPKAGLVGLGLMIGVYWMVFSMCLLLAVGGWICLLGMGITRRLLGGLRGGRSSVRGREYLNP